MNVSKNREKNPKMDGENNGKPYEQMDDLGVYTPIFGLTPKCVLFGKKCHHQTGGTLGVPFLSVVKSLQSHHSLRLGCPWLVLRINGCPFTPIKVGWIRPVNR